MSYKKTLTVAAIPALAVSLMFGTHSTALAAEQKISGATAWGPCTYHTSENVRSTSVKNKQVRVKLDAVGKLGVKMRSVAEVSGATSADAYFPANGFQNLGKYSAAGTQFRLQFTCVNSRRDIFDRPSTNFQGTLDR